MEDFDAKRNSIFSAVARHRRSKLEAVPKQNQIVVDPGKYKNEEHIIKSNFTSTRYTPRKRKKKNSSDSCETEVSNQYSRVRGQRRGNLSSSITHEGKLDSKTFDGYLEHIWGELPEEKRNTCIFLDSLWFSLYLQSSFREKVLSWIKRKTIFTKRYVLVPIVLWCHWNLLILCHFGESSQSKRRAPCMLLLDSLHKLCPTRLEPGIRKLVLDLHNIEDRPENKKSIGKIPLLIPKVPQQRNGEECGWFVLYYISLFLERAPEKFSFSDGYPYFMKEDWFSFDGLDNFCRTLETNSTRMDLASSEDALLEL